MSGQVRTEWNLAELTDADPFAEVTYSNGVQIDLGGSEEELGDALVKLLWREGRYAERGITCPLKDNGQECLTCPKATLDPDERRSVLCRLGKDQSTVEARHDQVRAARLASVGELAQEIDAASELAVLPEELEEYLTQVGV